MIRMTQALFKTFHNTYLEQEEKLWQRNRAVLCISFKICLFVSRLLYKFDETVATAKAVCDSHDGHVKCHTSTVERPTQHDLIRLKSFQSTAIFRPD